MRPLLFIFAALISPVHALIVYDSPSSTTNTAYESAPANGSPWQYVAGVNNNGQREASGVYLGNGFVLTAGHVSLTGAVSVLLSGSTYLRDTSYSFNFFSSGVDLKLFRILGDPGLSVLPIIADTDSDLNKASTLIGWGVGKATGAGGDPASVVSGQGWNWSTLKSTMVERWGTNTTENTSYIGSGNNVYLGVDFDSSAGEASMTLGDSGGALFQKFGSTWKLSGIMAAVEISDQSLYDKIAGGGETPSLSYALRLKNYNDALTTATAVPEPGTASLLIGSALLWLGRRRRKATSPR